MYILAGVSGLETPRPGFWFISPLRGLSADSVAASPHICDVPPSQVNDFNVERMQVEVTLHV